MSILFFYDTVASPEIPFDPFDEFAPDPSRRHTSLSGIEINQNVLSDAALLSDLTYQTFFLPANYARGFNLPDITGIQFCCNSISADQVVANVSLEVYELGTWTILTKGLINVPSLYDTQEWIDVYFNEPILINSDWLSSQFRIGIQCDLPVWFSTTVPLPGQTEDVYGGQLAFRLLTFSADSGQDFLSNRYRSLVRRSPVSAVTTVATDNPDSFWLSKPNPSKYAVESLYFDVSNLEDPSVVDRVLIDPITPGPYFTIYYSSEGEPGISDNDWEQKLWTPVAQQFRMERRTEFALPAPITARYLKVEFSHLQAQHYSPGTFAQPIRYKKHPKWVLDYFLARLGDPGDDPFVARNVQVVYNTLNIGYDYFLDDLHQDPKAPIPSESQLSNFLLNRSDESDQIDHKTLVQLQTDLAPYLRQPGARSPGTDYLPSAYGPPLATEYSVERKQPLRADVTQVSQLDRNNLIVEQNTPVMFYYTTCRHTYRELEASFVNDRAYFVGIRELAFIRDHYTAPSDTETYVDNLGDTQNVVRNDFLES